MTTDKYVLNGLYEVLSQVQGALGNDRVDIGQKNVCRYCESTGGSRFRKTAHTFPEALGNKWVFSLDECDDCNGMFSVYENELVKAISPILTLGGVKGKRKRARQTGRTAGSSVLKHLGGEGRRRISMILKSPEEEWEKAATFDPVTGKLRLAFPVAPVPFIPRHAYKAVTKMGVALLPEMELKNFRQLTRWLLASDDSFEFPCLEVGLSCVSIGNAPALVCGTVLRRVNSDKKIPYMLFVLSMGSICLQIDLMPDELDNSLAPRMPGGIKIKWVNQVGRPSDKMSIRLDYGEPVFFNWSRQETVPQPVERIVVEYNTRTNAGSFTPEFRHDALIA